MSRISAFLAIFSLCVAGCLNAEGTKKRYQVTLPPIFPPFLMAPFNMVLIQTLLDVRQVGQDLNEDTTQY